MTVGFGDPQTVCTEVERTWASQPDPVKWQMLFQLQELQERRDLDRRLAIQIAYLVAEIQRGIDPSGLDHRRAPRRVTA